MRKIKTSFEVDADLWARVKAAAKPGAIYQYVEKALWEKLKREEAKTEAQSAHKTDKESL